MKPAGRDQGFSTEGFPFISIFVQLLTLVVTKGRVLFVVFVFIVDVVVLLLLLLCWCTLSLREMFKSVLSDKNITKIIHVPIFSVNF
jgi:hypothetical protein